jgi:hypothetical protein
VTPGRHQRSSKVALDRLTDHAHVIDIGSEPYTPPKNPTEEDEGVSNALASTSQRSSGRPSMTNLDQRVKPWPAKAPATNKTLRIIEFTRNVWYLV